MAHPCYTGHMTSTLPTTVAERKALFLQELEKHRRVKYVAEQLKIDRTTPYMWRDDPEFAAAWDDIMAPRNMAVPLEETAYVQALGGNTKLLMFLLEHLWPERYGQRVPGGMGGGAPTIIIQVDEPSSMPMYAPTQPVIEHEPVSPTLAARAAYLALHGKAEAPTPTPTPTPTPPPD